MPDDLDQLLELDAKGDLVVEQVNPAGTPGGVAVAVPLTDDELARLRHLADRTGHSLADTAHELVRAGLEDPAA